MKSVPCNRLRLGGFTALAFHAGPVLATFFAGDFGFVEFDELVEVPTDSALVSVDRGKWGRHRSPKSIGTTAR